MGYDLFISYRRSDSGGHARNLHDRLCRYFDRERIFFDRESIESGDVFPDRLRQGVSEAKVVLALIAQDWLSVKDEKGKHRLLDPRDYVRKEIALALELEKKIIPVLIDHESFPKAKNLPKCLQNLTSCDAHLLRGKTAEYDAGLKTLVRLISKIPGMPPSKIPFMVEKLPEDFVPRPDEMNQLRSIILKREADKSLTITAALKGAGGYGKTTLAMALCHDEDVKHAFDDGILWTTLGKKPGNLIGKIEDLIYKLTEKRPGFTAIEAAADELGKLLSERNILIVIDDVWDKAHLKPFMRGEGRSSHLITTTILDTLPDKAEIVDVDAMRREEAIQLLRTDLPQGEEKALGKLAARLGEWPMLLKLVNKQLLTRVKNREPLSNAVVYVNRALDKKGLTYFDARNPEEQNLAVAKTIGASLELLEANELERFEELAIFPEDTKIPLETVGRLWLKTGGCDEFDIATLCGRLYGLSLLLGYDLAARHIRLHDVMRCYLIDKRGKEIAQVHSIFLDSYLTSDSQASSRLWGDLPKNESYLWNNLSYHLSESQGYHELRALFADTRWMNARIAQSDYLYSGYIADLDVAWDMAEKTAAEDEIRFTECFRYALIRTSINSIAGNYPPELVARAVEEGIWSIKRALDIAARIPYPEIAADFYNTLLRIKNLDEQNRSLSQMKGLEAALAIPRSGGRAIALAAMAPQLSVSPLQREWETAFAEATELYRAELLSLLTTQLSELKLEDTFVDSPELFRATLLSDNAPQLSGDQREKDLRHGLEAALAIPDGENWANALSAMAFQLSIEQREVALQRGLEAAITISDERSRAHALAALAPQLSGSLLQRGLEAAFSISDKKFRAHALAALAPQLSGEQREEALQRGLDAALAISDEWSRGYALAALAPQLSGSLLQQALEPALANSHIFFSAEILASLAPQLSGKQREEALQRGLDTALASDVSCASGLATLAPHLSGSQLQRGLEAARGISYKFLRVHALAALALQLSGEQREEALQRGLDAALAIPDQKDRASALSALASQLSGSLLHQAMEAALAISDEWSRAKALTGLATQLSGEQREEALQRGLDAAIVISDEWGRAEALTGLASQLSGEQRLEIIRQSLEAAKAISSGNQRAFVVSERMKFMKHSEGIKSAIDCLRWMKGSNREFLLDLCSSLPQSLRLSTMTFDIMAGHIIEICFTWKWL